MKASTVQHTVQFCYDCGKLSFAVLVVGNLARKPVVPHEVFWGAVATLLLLGLGVIINEWKGGSA